MKAIYAKYGDSYYKLNERVGRFYPNILIDENKIEVTKKEKVGEIYTNLNLGLINSNINTNKEEFENMISILKEQRVTEIQKLEPFFEVSIDFTLFDSDTDEVIDDGVMTRHLTTPHQQNFYNVLGIDVENEMYTRLVKQITSEFVFNYRESVPCGIMGKPKRHFIFKIHNIRIHQLIFDEERYKDGIDKIDIYHKSSEGVAITRESFEKKYNRPKDVVVFDANLEGIEISPIEIDGTFRKFVLHFEAALNNYIVVMNDNTVDEILELESDFEGVDGKVISGGDASEETE